MANLLTQFLPSLPLSTVLIVTAFQKWISSPWLAPLATLLWYFALFKLFCLLQKAVRIVGNSCFCCNAPNAHRAERQKHLSPMPKATDHHQECHVVLLKSTHCLYHWQYTWQDPWPDAYLWFHGMGWCLHISCTPYNLKDNLQSEMDCVFDALVSGRMEPNADYDSSLFSQLPGGTWQVGLTDIATDSLLLQLWGTFEDRPGSMMTERIGDTRRVLLGRDPMQRVVHSV